MSNGRLPLEHFTLQGLLVDTSRLQEKSLHLDMSSASADVTTSQVSSQEGASTQLLVQTSFELVLYPAKLSPPNIVDAFISLEIGGKD